MYFEYEIIILSILQMISLPDKEHSMKVSIGLQECPLQFKKLTDISGAL